jgi:hypothetical protein
LRNSWPKVDVENELRVEFRIAVGVLNSKKVESGSVRGSMQNDGQAGTVIFVSNGSPEATVLQDIEAHGLVMQWARSISAAVDLLNSPREKTVIVTELALADGN